MLEERILIWAHPRDARLTTAFLEDAGLTCSACQGLEEVAREWHRGAGAFLVAGELLTPAPLTSLQALLEAQPPWSDLAVIIVAAEVNTDQVDAFVNVGNVSLLQRPLSLNTLRSTVSAALRARRRQYQVRALLQQKDEAERRKDEFLAMLAHELRNPLAPLRTGLQLLRLRPTSDVADRTHVMMERQIINLTRLIDDLLDVSRITRRKIALRQQPLDVRECIRQAADAMQHRAREKGIRLEVNVPSRQVVVAADAVRLEQMIGNLLSNAVKFTPPNGTIHVSVDCGDDEAVLRVSDTGIGIASEQLDKVFDLFAQAPTALDRSDGGLGIGLTVVRLLAELHGGTAEIFSGGVGRGTEAIVRLPVVQEKDLNVAGHSHQAQPACGRRRILVIEDNQDAAEVLSTYLGHLGHEVIVVHDGHAGLEAAFRHHPDVLICDIGLPGVDGYEIGKRLRAESNFDDCLMIAVTGYGDVADRERTRAAGFSHHLTKPADPTRVAALIATSPGNAATIGDRGSGIGDRDRGLGISADRPRSESRIPE